MMLSEEFFDALTPETEIVLILVLVDDALWEYKNKVLFSFHDSLNPCFSGWCSLSMRVLYLMYPKMVLILVLVDDALWAKSKLGKKSSTYLS